LKTTWRQKKEKSTIENGTLQLKQRLLAVYRKNFM